MGKEFKNIDDLYRTYLNGNADQVPDFVKANIDEAIGFNKRRKRYFVFALIALIGFSGIGVALMESEGKTVDTSKQVALNLIHPHHKDKPLREDYPQSSQYISAQVNNNTITNDEPTSLSDSHPYQEEYITNNNLNLTSAPVESTLNNPENRLPVSNENSLAINREEVVQDEIQPMDISNQVDESVVSIIDASERNEVNEKSNAPSVDDITETEQNNNISPAVQVNSKNEEVTESDTDVETEIEPERITEDLTEENEDNNENKDLSDLPEPDPIEEDEDDKLTENNADIDKTEPDRYRPIMLSLTSGVNKVVSAYGSSDMNETTQYENASVDKLGFQTNLDVTYRFKNGLMIGSGLSLIDFNESLDFSTTSLTVDSTELVTHIYEHIYTEYIDPEMDTTLVGGLMGDSSYIIVDSTITYNYDSTFVKNDAPSINNRARYMSLPIHMGAQMQWNKFQLDLYASVRFNFLLSSSGGYMNGEEFINFDKSNSIYKPFYTDLMLGSKIHYRLVKNLYATSTVQFRPVVGNSYTGTNFTFNKKLHYTHFGIGLSLKL